MQDPEVNDVSYDEENQSVSVEVRIVRNSACCGDEMKESTFNTDADVPDEIVAKMEAVKKEHPDAEFDASEGSCEPTEEGGHRYKKSYFGYTLQIEFNAIYDGSGHDLGSMEVTDQIQASAMDELT
jgi:hypothetical protein